MVRRLEREELERRLKYGSRQRMLTVVCVGAPICIVAGLIILMIGIPHLQELMEGEFHVMKVRQITRRLVMLGINLGGLALVLWGCFLIPRTVGFYKKYK
jgi:hypothetical protein